MGSQRLKKVFVLDTCAWVWIANGEACITQKIQQILSEADWLVSAISIWEIAMLVAKKRIELNCSIERWVEEALIKVPGIVLAPLLPEIAIASCNLENNSHADPADRIIIATGIHYQAGIVTADKKILEYCQGRGITAVPI